AGATPIETLGTNKLQSVFGSGSATFAYARAGHVNLSQQMPMGLASLIASMFGAFCATLLPQEVFRQVLPFVLVAIALYFVLKPDVSDLDTVERIKPAIFGLTIVPVIGFYDGIFGPGTGSFFMLGFVALAGFGLLKATAHTKFLNFASNLGSLIVFAFMGVVLWKTALAMGVGQFLGARLGAKFAMKNGAEIIKPLLVLVCVALAARLAWQSWGG
ncbi:MAG: TSUP family transporter, partial [Notoacmeibacter sp.]